MLPKTITSSLMALLVIFAGAIAGQAQSIDRDYEYGQDDYERVKIDRNLDVEVWSDHYDGEYYDGNNIVVYFRASRDAFVSIYSIDTRGRVNLLFPIEPGEDNFVRGGVTYSLPGDDADFDLEVNGPEGFENIQIVASREKFDIPNWYHNSGMVCDWDDRDDYMDWLNANYFVRYSGQRFAYDRAVIYVNEWEPDYYRPIYDPYYPSWTVYGNCYVDYPFGASVYVNGIYWGCAPLYIPRIAVGWHVVTIYDTYGHCWESDFHVSRYNTVIFDRSVVHPAASVKSKYKEVRAAGYRNPVTNGYPSFKNKTVVNNNLTVNNSTKVVGKSTSGSSGKTTAVGNYVHKYVRGSTKLVKTDRGYETDASSAVIRSGQTKIRTGSTSRVQNTVRTNSSGSKSTKGSSSTKSSNNSYRSSSSSSSGSGYYQKKSGSSSKHSGSNSVSTGKSGKSSSSSGSTYKRSSGSTKSGATSGKTGSYKRSSGATKSGSSSKKSGGRSSSKSGSYKRSSGATKSSGSSTKSNSSSGSYKRSSSSNHSSGSVKSSSSSKAGGGSKATRSSSSSSKRSGSSNKRNHR